MKNLSNKLYKYIIEHSILTYLLVGVTIIVFHKVLENFLSVTLVKFIFSEVKSNFFNDLLISFLLITYIFIVTNTWKQRKNKVQLLIVNVSTIFLYTYYRFISDRWHFIAFNFYDLIYYFDGLYVICLSNLIYLIDFELDKTNKGFFENEAITSSDNDLLGFKVYAEQLANQIKVTHHNKAFAIGINGSWGSGKSSFLNLLKNNFTKEDYIIIEFNAWYSNTPNQIIKDFFDTLNEQLKTYNASITKLLHNYSKKLVGLHENETTKLVNNLFSFLSDNSSINSVYNQIEKEISIIDKKIIVVIDDLDRLDSEEIVEVIRLIRNTANFKNVIFIVAYDREYIIKALDNHNSYNSDRFLEKIIQLELTLPYFKKDIYATELAKLIKEKVNIETVNVGNSKLKEDFIKEFYAEIDTTLLASNITETYYIYKWIENQRDVIRLANALILNINILVGEIVFADFLRIELLRLKYPSIYLFFFNNLDLFLENIHDNNKNRFQLKKTEKSDSNYYLIKYLNNEKSLTQIERDKIYNLLEGIFYEKGKIRLGELRPLSIVFPSNINRYVAYKLLEGSLSYVEFSNARLSKLDEFKNKINEWIDSNLEFEIKQKFREIKDFNSKEDFENVIQAIFYLANQKTKINTYPFNIISFDFEYLFDILIYNSNKNIKSYYTSKVGNQEYKNFIISLFKNAKSPYYFESELLISWNKDKFTIYDNEYIISKEYLNDISIEYLQKYEASITVLNDDFLKLFYRTRNTNRVEVNGRYNETSIYPKKSISTFKSLINKDLNSFLN